MYSFATNQIAFNQSTQISYELAAASKTIEYQWNTNGMEIQWFITNISAHLIHFGC